MSDTDELEVLRARAAEHDEDLQSVKWYTVAQLAKRWQVSESTVRAVAWEHLRYKEFGQGETHKRRRYRADWVDAYENESGRSAA